MLLSYTMIMHFRSPRFPLVVRMLLSLVALTIVGSGIWYLWYTYGWRTYTIPCLDGRFAVPVSIPVPIRDDSSQCTSAESNAIYIVVGQFYHDAPISVVFSQLPSINDAVAMQAVGMADGSSVAQVLQRFAANHGNGSTTLTTIHGRQAAITFQQSPDPEAMVTPVMDTTETALIDAGHQRVLRVEAAWLSSDTKSGAIDQKIIDSVTFSGS